MQVTSELSVNNMLMSCLLFSLRRLKSLGVGLILLTPILFPLAYAQEKLGYLEIEELLIKTQYQTQESSGSKFLFKDSGFFLKWSNAFGIESRFAIGDNSLLNRSQIFNASDSQGITVIEGYIGLTGHWGQLQMGLQPVGFGRSGDLKESQLFLERSYIYRQNLMALRDLGLRYSVSNKGFYTTLFIHNGEAFDDLDHELWFTSEWGWKGPGPVDIGVAAQTGLTNSDSTSSSTSEFLLFDKTKSAKWRVGQAYAYWLPHEWDVKLELTQYELEQNQDIKVMITGLFAVGFKKDRHWRYDFRYEFMDQNKDITGDQLSAVDLAVTYQSLWGNSRLSLIATHNLEEANNVENNTYRIVWQMTSLANY